MESLSIPVQIQNNNFPKTNPNIKHLLSRALLVPSSDKYSIFNGKSRKEVVEILLDYVPVLNSFPLKDYDAVQSAQPDFRVSFGKTWIYDLNYDSLINEKRKNSLINWIIGVLCQESPNSLMPRMFLFWTNFFNLKLSKIPFAPKAFRHFDVIRNHSLGNFADLLTEIIADPGMIYYYRKLVPGEKKIYDFVTQQLIGTLTGHQIENTRLSREKLRKLASVINKWHFICDNADLHFPNLKPMDIYKEENKQYYDAYFGRSGAQEVLEELRHLINLILDYQTAVSLSELLFENFLTKDKKEEYRHRLIVPTAEAFYHSKFEISTWLREFLLNDAFFKPDLRNNLPKKPLDFLLRLSYQFKIVKPSTSHLESHFYWEWLARNTLQLGQNLFGSDRSKEETIFPDEERNALLFSRALHNRYIWVDRLLESGYILKDKLEVVDTFEFVKQFIKPSDAMSLIDEAVERLYCKPLLIGRKKLLVESCLLDGMKDYKIWTNLWNDALCHAKKDCLSLVSQKLKNLFKFLLIQPEYDYY